MSLQSLLECQPIFLIAPFIWIIITFVSLVHFTLLWMRGTKMITYNVSTPFLSPSPVFDLHFQQCLLTPINSLTHTHTHTQWAHSLSLSHTHTHTDQQRKIPTGFDLFMGMKNQSVFKKYYYYYFFFMIQFHNLDHNVGNLDGVQIADKASFLVYSLFFQLFYSS